MERRDQGGVSSCKNHQNAQRESGQSGLLTSKIFAVSGVESLGHQVDFFDHGRLAVGNVALGAGRATELIVLWEEVKNENGTALVALIRRMRRAFVAVYAVQNGIAHCAGILSPV